MIPIFRAKRIDSDGKFKPKGKIFENTEETYNKLIELGYTSMFNVVKQYKEFSKWKYLFINNGNENLDASNKILDKYELISIKDIEKIQYEYVEGYLTSSNAHSKVGSYYIEDGSSHCNEIDQSTLAIHFPSMVDKNGKKIFASLSEDGVGGDILNDGVNCDFIAMLSIKGLKILTLKDRKGILYTRENLEVTGIHQ